MLWMIGDAVTDTGIVDLLLKAGPVGIVLLGFVTGWLWAKPAVEQLQRDLDRALADLRAVRKEQRELEAANREIIIPAIVRFVEIGEKLQEKLGE